MRTALCVLCLGFAAAGQDFGRVTALQAPQGTHVYDTVYADVNGDGLRDLVVSLSDWRRQGSTRSLRVHLQRKAEPPFHAEPDHVVDPADAVAYAVADVHADPGAEIVLFARAGVWAYRLQAPEKERTVKLIEAAFLWQLPDDHRAVAWEAGVLDWNGDGLQDLVIPEPDGYRLAAQVRDGEGARFPTSQLLRVPVGKQTEATEPRAVRLRARQLRDRVVLRLSSTESGPGKPLLEINDSVPAPQLRDWDGDGDLDLLATTENRLFVWKQGAHGFGANADHSYPLPVVADRSRRLDVSYSAHAQDLNRDGRVDCVIFSGDLRSKHVRTQVQIFVQGDEAGSPLFGAEGLPQQLLLLAGFAGNPRLDDVNGDGYPDLLLGTIRPDLLDTLRAAARERVNAQLFLFLSRKGRFERKPDLTFKTSVEARGLRFRRPILMARFFADLTGDGVRELLLRDEKASLKVFLTRRGKSGLTIHARPLWTLRIDERAEVRLPPRRAGRPVPLLVVEREQVLYVRFE